MARDGSTYRSARRNACHEEKSMWGPEWYFKDHRNPIKNDPSNKWPVRESHPCKIQGRAKYVNFRYQAKPTRLQFQIAQSSNASQRHTSRQRQYLPASAQRVRTSGRGQ
jgi:hypothetical protein